MTLEELPKKILRFFLDTLQTFVIALTIFIILYQVAGRPHVVNGSSMEPNFEDGELILTEKVSYYFKPPQRGDVVVFRYPLNTDLDYIKRIIGLPGDVIRLDGRGIYVNSKRLNEEYLATGTYTTGHSTIPEGQNYLVTEGQYVVMGDNRERSSDSREWGTVASKNIIGRAFFRYWPFPKLGLVKHYSL